MTETDIVPRPKVPGIADRVIMIDYDGTIFPWGSLSDRSPIPYDGVRNAINALIAEGFIIGIFTSRLSPTWMQAAGTTEKEQREHIDHCLKINGIAYHFSTSEKVPAEAYFDDMAYRVGEGQLASALAVWRLSRDG